MSSLTEEEARPYDVWNEYSDKHDEHEAHVLDETSWVEVHYVESFTVAIITLELEYITIDVFHIYYFECGDHNQVLEEHTYLNGETYFKESVHGEDLADIHETVVLVKSKWDEYHQ